MQLDGTDQGLQHARSLVSEYRNLDRWNFQTARPESVTVGFSSAPTGPYEGNPEDPKDVKYVQVTAQGAVTLYFMPGFSTTAPVGMILVSIGGTQKLSVQATSGQVLVDTFYDNLLPYSPDALDADDPNFGYTKGSMYTLRWPPAGQRADPADPPLPGSTKWENWCQGDRDAGYVTNNASPDRGFIDIGDMPGSGGSAYIRQAIISNVQTHPLAKGDPIINVRGNRGVESRAMRDRFAQDSDTTSQNYAEYLANLNDPSSITFANGRRLVIAPVNNPATDTVVDFGLFFLHSDVCGDPNDNTASCCAEYVGSAQVPPRGRTAADPDKGAYKVRLLR